MTTSTPQELSERPETSEARLAIGGMTCASCSARIEKRLNRLPGVTSASVNLATEKARVGFSAPLTLDDIVREIEKTGYAARPLDEQTRAAAPAAAPTPASEESEPTDGPATSTAAAPASPAPAETPKAPPTADTLLRTFQEREAARQAAAQAGARQRLTDAANGIAAKAAAAERSLRGEQPKDARPNGPSGASGQNAAAPPAAPPSAAAAIRPRLIVAIPLTIIVFLLAMVLPKFGASPWLEWIFATPVVFWCAWPFHRAAYLNAKHGASTMDTLVSIGVLAAYAYSVVDVLRGGTHLYFEVAAVVTTFLLTGRFLEARAKDSGKDALRSLLDLGAKEVSVLRIDPSTRITRETRIPVDELVVGDHFMVRPGEKVATDGVVLDGASAIDASLLTGESTPVDVAPGSEVTGGAINTTGRLVVEAKRVGSETMLAGIRRLVEDAQTGKAQIQRLADRVSAIFVPAVLAIALITFIGWLVTGHDVSRSLAVAVTVLIIACPCALGLATPMALMVGTGRGAQLGTLIKGPQVLEDTRRVDTIVLDKTGTVTSGDLQLRSIAVVDGLAKTAALKAAAAIEANSEHPIAAAIVAGAHEAHIDLPKVTDFTNNPGEGATGRINGQEVVVGKPSLFERVDPALLAHAEQHAGTTVFAGWDGEAKAAFTVEDTVRDSSRAAIARLGALGLQVHLLTGDNPANARSVAEQVGIDPSRVIADVLPADKFRAVSDLQATGRTVAMVGDGVNDAAALAQADLGLAMGSGTDVAMDSADIVLVRPDLDAAADAIELSRATLKTIKQNLAWAFGYNVAAIPVAAFGLLNPMIAGGAMAASSVLVVLNSLRLKRFGRH